MFFRMLPWEYAIRNLFRRPLRTLLTFLALTTVIVLVLVVVGFIRGLERSLANTGNPQTALVFSLGMGENLEYSSIAQRTRDLVRATVDGIQQHAGQASVSPELYLASQVNIGDHEAMGLLRGVTRAAIPVRSQVEIQQGRWPKPGEIMVGQLVAAKLGVPNQELQLGQTIQFENRDWKISGIFSANGSAFEAEVWCRLDDLQQALKRQDLSVVAVNMNSSNDFVNLELFCKERLDLELQAMRETDYYASLNRDYGPIRWLAWLVVVLVSSAGVFAGLNTMYGSVVGRVRELATLQTIGFSRRALVLSLVQEGVILASAASLLAALFALSFVNNVAVRFTMGAFALSIDNITIMIGCLVGLMLGFIGTIPPTFRALKLPIVIGLKAL